MVDDDISLVTVVSTIYLSLLVYSVEKHEEVNYLTSNVYVHTFPNSFYLSFYCHSFCRPKPPTHAPTIPPPHTKEPTLTLSKSPTVRPMDSPVNPAPAPSPTDHHPVFPGKSGKIDGKAYKTRKPKASKDSKSAKSVKSAKSAKGSKSSKVVVNMWKPSGWDYMQYGKEDFRKFDAKKTNASDACSMLGAGIVVSFVASLLLARQ